MADDFPDPGFPTRGFPPPNEQPTGPQSWRAPAPGEYARLQPALAPPPRRKRRRALPVLSLLTAFAVAVGSGSYLVYEQQRSTTGALRGVGGSADTSASRPAPGGTPPASAPSTQAYPVLTVPQVSAVVTPGVVLITAQLGSRNVEAAGTGMVLTPTGEILTNNHVVAGAVRITVTVANSPGRYTADVVGTSPADDVALLRLQGASGLSTVPLGNSDSVRKGQRVVAIGNAGGRGTLSTVSGLVTSTDQSITASDANGGNQERLSGMIAAEADIEAGDSGGPLADLTGRVIGVNTAASASEGRQASGPGAPTYGFAIPINRALAVADTIRGGAVAPTTLAARGYLGIRVGSAVPPAGGVQVTRVVPGSPADRAGIVAGDVVTSLDGDPVDSPAGLTGTLAASSPGQSVTIGWTDGTGAARVATVQLSATPGD